MAQRSITPRPLGAAAAVPDPTQALVGSVRRTTVVTRDLQASGYGYRPGSRVRVVVLAPPQHATEPADASTSGMIGLLSLLDEQPAGVPPAPDGLLRAGEVVVLLNTRRIFAVHEQLRALGYAPTVPTPLRVPD